MFVLECSMPLEWLLICYLGENIRCWVWIIMASYRPVQHGNNSCSLRFESSNARHALLYTVHWSASKAVLGIVTVIALSPSPSPRKQKIILSQGVTLLFIEGVHLDSDALYYHVLQCSTEKVLGVLGSHMAIFLAMLQWFMVYPPWCQTM
jgi:hypothetical protein